MSNIVENVASSLGILGQVLVNAAWEGAKIGASGGGNIIKKTLKGAVKGIEVTIKAITEK